MDPTVKTILIFDFSSGFLTDREEIDTVFGQYHEVIGRQQEASDWRFPELVAFMPVFDKLGFEVDYSDVECVDTDALVADNDGAFFYRSNLAVNFNCTSLFHNGHIAVTDVQLGRPVDEILIHFSVGIVDIDLNEIISKLTLLLVSQDIEVPIILNNVLDGSNFLFVIIVEFMYHLSV